MGLTEGSGSGTDVATTDIEIVEPGHFLAAGLSGTVPVLTDITGPDWGTARFGMGIAGPEATVIATATLSDGQTYDFIFVYEKGAKLAQAPADGSDQVAADIRVCLGFDVRSYPLWNENAYALFEAAINYALGLVGPQTQARLPKPNNGVVDVAQEAFLSWKAGTYAVSHNLYFGKVAEDVNAADPANPLDVLVGQNQTINAYDPPGLLDFGETYYWRVDEINDLDPNSPWRGDLWSFTVINYFIVDDFEGYDAGDNQIWVSWHDGLGYGAPGVDPYFAGNGTGAAVGDETTDSYTEETIVHGGRQSMPLSYDNNKQGYSKYSETELTLAAPRDWTEEGVAELSLWFRGYPASVGSFVEGPVGTYTMTGSGADIWNVNGVEADEFHFAYKMLTGAGSIVAKVESLQNTNVWAKAGVMIRESLDPDSKHAFACVTPENGVASQGRPDTGAASFNNAQSGITAPHWVKLERDLSGNFTVFHSANGSAWEAVTGATPQNIQMSSNVYIGLALTSHDAALTCQAVFSNVTITGSVGPQWTNQDIGIASNAAEPLYVAVSNTAGTPAVVVHDDPAAATTDTWTEWVIPLQAFADQDINLTDVDRIAIGLGIQGNTTVPGGSGKMFFDDIRLYQPEPEPEPEPEP